ncbi:MAG: hypothetical protein A4E45_01945 [Methanosaeta sp. PtaB.Bin039]|nr:MAG: hypothetical protein A4E45_01945 [Methanosaeta sp. PtaB.Bin039]HOT07683.1 DUF1894 domain-containing protein [Methanotrichaceae archaeon]HQF17516.1 DUF1894 domain-containing protein [Methanotrichaceae archaeon]HQI92079.1 DUF1894 domain-containing protein [Methanotrichaceae archaeon]HQJ29318.1 DUF1894 domain-containing protein [Methanotrichaceae archaeon]
MGCIEELKPETLLQRISFKEAREFIEKNSDEYYYFQPGFQLFGEHLVGVPPLAVGIKEGYVVFPYTKPCHGTFVLRYKDEREAERVRKLGKEEVLKSIKKVRR